MRQETVNSFTGGMIMDLHPLTTPNNVLTGCLNGTILTRNGDEYILQNDLGNGRVETAYLPPGFVPIGVKEFGGIIYVVSYNPLTNKSQIGSFPSPERNINKEEMADVPSSSLTYRDFGMGAPNNFTLTTMYQKKTLMDGKINSGDKFIISASGLNSAKPSISDMVQGEYLSDRKIVRLHLASIDDNNNITYIEKDLDWSQGYWMVDSTTLGGDPTDLASYRQLIQSGVYNVYNSKISGKLVVIAELEAINTFDVYYDPVEVTAIDDEHNSFTFTIYTRWESTPPEINAAGVRCTLEGAALENPGTGYIDTNDSTLDILNVKATNVNGSTFTYEISPYMSYGILNYLTKRGEIDLNQIGTGLFGLSEWRYYVDNDNLLLSWGLNANPKPGFMVKGVTFHILEYNATNSSQIIVYNTPQRPSYNGNFTESIVFGQTNAKFLNGASLKKGTLYLVQGIIKNGLANDDTQDDYQYFYRMLYTNGIFNSEYFDPSIQDFKGLNVHLNTLVDVDITPRTPNTVLEEFTANLSVDAVSTVDPSSTFVSTLATESSTIYDVELLYKYENNYNIFEVDKAKIIKTPTQASRKDITTPDVEYTSTGLLEDVAYKDWITPQNLPEDADSTWDYDSGISVRNLTIDKIQADKKTLRNNFKISSNIPNLTGTLTVNSRIFRPINAKSSTSPTTFNISKAVVPYFDPVDTTEVNSLGLIEGTNTWRLQSAVCIAQGEEDRTGKKSKGAVRSGTVVFQDNDLTLYSQVNGWNGHDVEQIYKVTNSGTFGDLANEVLERLGRTGTTAYVWRSYSDGGYLYATLRLTTASRGNARTGWFGNAWTNLTEKEFSHRGNGFDDGTLWGILLWKTEDGYLPLNSVFSFSNRSNVATKRDQGMVRGSTRTLTMGEVLAGFASQFYVAKDVTKSIEKYVPAELYYTNNYTSNLNYTLSSNYSINELLNIKPNYSEANLTTLLTMLGGDAEELSNLVPNIKVKATIENQVVDTPRAITTEHTIPVVLNNNHLIEVYLNSLNQDGFNNLIGFDVWGNLYSNQNLLERTLYWFDPVDKKFKDLTSMKLFRRTFTKVNGSFQVEDDTSTYTTQNLSKIFSYRNNEMIANAGALRAKKAVQLRLHTEENNRRYDATWLYDVKVHPDTCVTNF